MPRPNVSARRPGAAGGRQSQNPIANWLERRKERRAKAENEAARMITNKIAQNENIIIDTLSAIDFYNSKLPKEVLERKAKPEHRCGELEYATKAIIATLRKNPQTIKMDIRKIDEKILTLVLLFKQAVEQGDTEAAYAARASIARAVHDIRCRIPQEQPELSRQFVEVNTEYLDQLVTLVLQAQQADRTKENVERQRKLLEKAEAEYEETVQKLTGKIQDDVNTAKAFEALSKRTHTKDRSSWTKEERELHSILVARRMEKVNLDLKRQMLQQQETSLMTTKGKMDVLFTHAANLPIPTDPDLLSKFQESVDNLFKRMFETDAEIENALKTMDDIEGRMQQLNNANGSSIAVEVATKEAERALDEIHKRQEIETGEAELQKRKLLKELGILTEEQLIEQRQQLEEKLREQEQELVEEQEEERERLLN